MLFIFVTAGNSTPISKRFPYFVAPSFSKNVSNSSSESNKKVNERIVSINHYFFSINLQNTFSKGLFIWEVGRNDTLDDKHTVTLYKSYVVFIWSRAVFHSIPARRDTDWNRRDPSKGRTKISIEMLAPGMTLKTNACSPIMWLRVANEYAQKWKTNLSNAIDESNVEPCYWYSFKITSWRTSFSKESIVFF